MRCITAQQRQYTFQANFKPEFFLDPHFHNIVFFSTMAQPLKKAKVLLAPLFTDNLHTDELLSHPSDTDPGNQKAYQFFLC